MRCIRGLALAVLCVIATPALAEEVAPPEVDSAARTFLSSEVGRDLFNTCPAEIWATRSPGLLSRLTPGYASRSSCAETPDRCAALCLEKNQAAACLYAANRLDNFDAPDIDHAARIAYALACAGGDGSGCTNRSAGLRNAPEAYDPLSELVGDAAAACYTPGFTLACEAGDAWGCAMEGQAYLYGEGVPEDDATARAKFEKACAITREKATDDSIRAPCRFARRFLERLDGG